MDSFEIRFPLVRQSAPIQKPMPIRIADTAITVRSMVSHAGMRVPGSVMPLLPTPYLGEKRRKTCELVHNPLLPTGLQRCMTPGNCKPILIQHSVRYTGSAKSLRRLA